MQFDWKSKTSWAIFGTAVASLASLVGITVTQDQINSLIGAFFAVTQGVATILGFAAWAMHQYSILKNRKTLKAGGMSHDDAVAATQS